MLGLISQQRPHGTDVEVQRWHKVAHAVCMHRTQKLMCTQRTPRVMLALLSLKLPVFGAVTWSFSGGAYMYPLPDSTAHFLILFFTYRCPATFIFLPRSKHQNSCVTLLGTLPRCHETTAQQTVRLFFGKLATSLRRNEVLRKHTPRHQVVLIELHAGHGDVGPTKW